MVPTNRKPLPWMVRQALLLASIAYRPTHSIDAAVKRRFGHGSTAPDRGQQVLPAHHTFAVINQKQEKIEYLRFDALKAWPAAQFPPKAVNGIVFENEQHLARPQPRDRVAFKPYGTPGVEKNQDPSKKNQCRRQLSVESGRAWNEQMTSGFLPRAVVRKGPITTAACS